MNECYSAAEALYCCGDCQNWPAALIGTGMGTTVAYLAHDQLIVGEDINPKALAAMHGCYEGCSVIFGTVRNMRAIV